MYENMNVIGKRIEDSKIAKPLLLFKVSLYMIIVVSFASIGVIFLESIVWIVFTFLCFAFSVVLYLYIRKKENDLKSSNQIPAINVIEIDSNGLAIYSCQGVRKLYTDAIKMVEWENTRVIFVLGDSKHKKYKVIAEYVEDAQQVCEKIADQCETLSPLSKRMGRPFIFNGENIFPIGDDAIADIYLMQKVILWFLALCPPVICLAWAIVGEWVEFAIGIGICFGIFTLYFVYHRWYKDNTNRREYPAIGLNESGNFMIFHNYKKIEVIKGKIARVSFSKYQFVSYSSSSSTSGGITTTTTTTSVQTMEYGKVIFYIEDDNGKQYIKVAKFVHRCKDVAEFINLLIN